MAELPESMMDNCIIRLFFFFLILKTICKASSINRSVYSLPSCFYSIMHFLRGSLQSTLGCLAKLFHFKNGFPSTALQNPKNATDEFP